MNDGLTSRHQREVKQDLEKIEELATRIMDKLKYRAAYLREQGTPNSRVEQAYEEVSGALSAANLAMDTLDLQPKIQYNEKQIEEMVAKAAL